MGQMAEMQGMAAVEDDDLADHGQTRHMSMMMTQSTQTTTMLIVHLLTHTCCQLV